MKVLLKGALKWLGIGAAFGVGTSAVTTSTGLTGGIGGFFTTMILVALGVFFVWLMFKLIKK